MDFDQGFVVVVVVFFPSTGDEEGELPGLLPFSARSTSPDTKQFIFRFIFSNERREIRRFFIFLPSFSFFRSFFMF